MSSEVKMELLRALVTECLTTAAEEILRLVHRTLVQEAQACSQWRVNDQPLEAEHRDPEPVRPQSDVEDPNMCWKVKIEEEVEVPIDALQKEDQKSSLSEPHSSVDAGPAHTDCGGDWREVPISHGPVASQSPQPICLFRVQTVPPQCRKPTLVSKNSITAPSARSNQPSSHSQNVPKNISYLRAGTELKPFKCPCCPRAFSLTKTLIRHMKVHAESYQCSMCGKCFCQKSHLESHMRVHTGEKPFCCQLCPESFSYKKSLIKHMAKGHLVGMNPLAGMSIDLNE
ncbi:unnamed protein product [Knipowitschia caucasica]|uniref:C2H2-type domain-containing protein n=1 Tax=Knipowitschia caucasica TaxID=637954 RepID=A0AAV2LIA2_KNICA